MTHGRNNRMSVPIRRLVATRSLQSAADRDLLQSFVDDRDEAAFRVIVERHGPMVFGVCRRALKCDADAEDALQAVFLVFAQRAKSIRQSGSLASWLHGVSLRVASRLRREQERRARRERRAARPIAADLHDPTWSEIQTALDDELARMPAVDRDVLVLCCLEGRTRDEAARNLGIGIDAVKGRLERARRKLADRLRKRGITLSAALLAAALAPDAHAAVLRIGVSVSPAVRLLSNQVLRGMTMRRLNVFATTAFALLAVAIGTGIAFPTATSSPDDPPKAVVGDPPAAKPKPNATTDGADERTKNALAFDVVLEDVNLTNKTLTARTYSHLIPPSGSTGGSVYHGHLPPGVKPARYERIPVMPEAEMKDKGLRSGMRATLRLGIVKGTLVVVGVERRLDPEKIGIDFLDAPTAKPKPDEPKWKKEFRKHYSMAEGEVVKRVHPFPACRTDCLKNEPWAPEGWNQNPGVYLTFRVRAKGTKEALVEHRVAAGDRNLQFWGFGGGELAVGGMIWHLGLPMHELEADPALLATIVGGDMVFLQDAPEEKRVAGLERILREECKLPVRIAFRMVKREVVVAKGKLKIAPLDGRDKNHVEIYAKEAVKGSYSGGGGSGHPSAFFNDLSGFVRKRIVSEAEFAPNATIRYSAHVRTPAPFELLSLEESQARDAEDHDLKTVLENVARQTGLTFTMEKRKVRVLQVERSEK